ncbi:EamA family transporter [Marinobacterium litorale]|uniref:EamA family transporter n=1 Tax=Marinobacterium litorale TaxID=404770 RepID=UPI000A010630|nr:EamA family transporter [Marinobacterium litorale]
MMDVFYALSSSIMFASTFLLVKIGREKSSHLSVLWITLSVNVLILCISSLLIEIPSNTKLIDLKYFILSGIFAPLLGRLFQFIGMSFLGANAATAITLTHPLFTVAIGLFFLGERASFIQMSGALLIIIGSLLISVCPTESPGFNLKNTSRNYLAYPLLASLTYGISIALRKVGIEEFNSPIIASAVTVCSSWSILTSYLIIRKIRIRCSRREIYYFIFAGVLSSLGPVLLYSALAIGNLLMVAPLAATTPLFVLLGTWFFSKNNENFNYPIVLGIIGIFIGLSLLTF